MTTHTLFDKPTFDKDGTELGILSCFLRSMLASQGCSFPMSITSWSLKTDTRYSYRLGFWMVKISDLLPRVAPRRESQLYAGRSSGNKSDITGTLHASNEILSNDGANDCHLSPRTFEGREQPPPRRGEGERGRRKKRHTA